MASMHAASAPVRAVRTPAGDPAWLVSGYDEVRALIALDQQLSDQPPQIVQQAARGLSGANVTVLNGTNGLGDLTAGLVSQGLRIFDSVRQNLGNDAPGTAPAVRQDGDR
jgi:hypothetical protein